MGGSAGKAPHCPAPAPCRYWLDYETYLVEKSLRETVDLPFLKAFVKNVSTGIAEDLHFSLSPSQVKRPAPADWLWPVSPGMAFRTLRESRSVLGAQQNLALLCSCRAPHLANGCW